MSLNVSVIDSAVQKRFTEFSLAVSNELRNKLSTHPSIVAYTQEFDKIRKLKDSFSNISNPSKHQ
jgi:hypothetical protein